MTGLIGEVVLVLGDMPSRRSVKGQGLLVFVLKPVTMVCSHDCLTLERYYSLHWAFIAGAVKPGSAQIQQTRGMKRYRITVDRCPAFEEEPP